MKTSTKLLLIYIGLIVAGILSLFITSSVLRDKQRYPKDVDYVQKTENLSDFSVVVVQENADCIVTVKESNSLLWFQPRDSMQKALSILVRNDTLYVEQTPSDDAYRVRIMAKHVKSILVKSGATLRLLNIIQDNLSVQIENGSCYLESIYTAEEAELQRTKLHLTIHASDKSYVEMNSWCTVLTTTLDSSRLLVNVSSDPNSFIRSVNLTASNGSTATFNRGPETLNQQKDSTSYVYVY